MSQNKIIHATSTSGSSLAICPACRKVVGKTTVILSMPFYPDIGKEFEMLTIEFEPAAYCQCAKEQRAAQKSKEKSIDEATH